MKINIRGIARSRRSAAAIVLLGGLACSPSALAASAADPAQPDATSDQEMSKRAGDSCVVCHSDARLLVENKKLYDYYAQWKVSVHHQMGVTCADCHGGDPTALDKDAAHPPKDLGEDAAASAVHYDNVPRTCAKCHEGIYEAYSGSAHALALEAPRLRIAAPNCVTCHGSVHSERPSPLTIAKSCARCHNEAAEHKADVPRLAGYLLRSFATIYRVNRSIAVEAEPMEAAAFARQLDPMLVELAALWHTFDLDRVEHKTDEILDFVKHKREEIRARSTD